MVTVGNTAISLLHLVDWDDIVQVLRRHSRGPEGALTGLLTCSHAAVPGLWSPSDGVVAR